MIFTGRLRKAELREGCPFGEVMFVHALFISYAFSFKSEIYFESNQFEKDCIVGIAERRYRFHQNLQQSV